MLSFVSMQTGVRGVSRRFPGLYRRRARRPRGPLLRASAEIASATVSALYSKYLESRWLEVTRIRIPVTGLPKAFHGFRIVQLSDFHHSSVVPMPFIERCIDDANSLGGDVIVLTGDYVTTCESRFTSPVVRAFRKLRARAGVYAVLGNHDHGIYKFRPSRREPLDVARHNYHFDSAGVRLLVNESVHLRAGSSALAIVGLDDLWGGGFEPYMAFDGIEPSTPRVVLCHNPAGVLGMRGFRTDLVLAGHTHGGQVVLPFVGPAFLPISHRRFIAGLYSVDRGLMYVNRGVGHLPPARINCHPEISVLELVARTA